MKQIWILVLSLLIVSSLFASGVTAALRTTHASHNRYEVVSYSETFESGGTGWTHYDGAVSPSQWHIYNDAGTQGNVWWMGDPELASGANIGGYYDHQYLVLDTPQILVPTANATLTFKLKYKVEALGTSGSYNGWDAINIRVSTDNGANWTVVSGTPAYNMTSAYSFGFEHGEGVGIAGWGGNSNGWQNATFNLSAYAGQNVKVRFAFASDPAESTGDDATLFGVMVDDIALGAYTNNGVNDGQMTFASLVPLGGDLWSIETVADAPSQTHAYTNHNAQNSYNVNMLNYLVSPPIPLPESGEIRADFMIKGSFTDPNSFPDVDFFGWEISINNGVTWNYMSNPYADPDGDNYVYSDAPDTWTSMTEGYSLDGYISDYAGETAIFRWYFESDADAPNGTGIMIDDFKIYNDIFLAEPANLTALVTGNNVGLTWTAPGGGGEPGWIGYCSDVNVGAIGGVATTLEAAVKWPPDGPNSILPYSGMNITQVQFWPSEAGVTYTIRIYTGVLGETAYSQVVTNPVIDAWNTVTLTTPFTIPTGTYVWVGYMCPITATQYPAGYDDTPAVAGYGNLIKTGTSWTTMTAADANWNIKAYVADATGRPVLINPYQPRNDREITAYKVYRDDAEIASVLPTVLNYTDTAVAGGMHTYKVTAVYGANESLPSNIVSAYVLPDNYSELGYNDGTFEQGFNVGSTNLMAVKYQYPNQVTLKYIKVYVTEVRTSPMIIRVYDDNGVDGMPGATQLSQFTYAASNIVVGWNYIPVPLGSDITIADGSFYVAILEYTSSSVIGLDTSQNGHSYKKTAAGWEAITNGEVMMQTIVLNNGTAGDDPSIAPLTFVTNNYPNPFNPETSINYTVPKDGQTSITIYNTKGQVVRSLLSNRVKAGSYKVSWNGKDDLGNDVASGVYYYRLDNNQKSITKKMLLNR